MQRMTTIDRMRAALQRYRIEQPDDYSYAVLGPGDFCELHEDFAAAFERRQELGLVAAVEVMGEAALEAADLLRDALAEAGETGLKRNQTRAVWQAVTAAVIAEYQVSRKGSSRAGRCQTVLSLKPQTS